MSKNRNKLQYHAVITRLLPGYPDSELMACAVKFCGYDNLAEIIEEEDNILEVYLCASRDQALDLASSYNHAFRLAERMEEIYHEDCECCELHECCEEMESEARS